MTYSLYIKKSDCDPTCVNGIKTWPEVTYHLRHKLDQWTIMVHIYKYSSDDRLLGEKCVTMSNLVDVCLALRDKDVLI